MKLSLISLAFIYTLLMLTCQMKTEQNKLAKPASHKSTTPAYAIVIHGGAGTITRDKMNEETEKAYRTALEKALDIGEKILSDGGNSLDAVVSTLEFMENSSLFNAGKGAVFTNAGKNELDASIMEGAQLNAGAVGGVTNIKNPIKAARAVLEYSEHVFLVGKGAETFAASQGIETVDPSYFYTDRRWKSLQDAKEREAVELDHDSKHGTVGCVALDQSGTIVAGTSTGGMTNKKYNRIGDSPIIGAGTYANNETCGVSCTGHGEFFIRYAVAHQVSSIMEYTGRSLSDAANHVINEKLAAVNGSGGLIALDKDGNIAMPFNTEGMYRGFAKPGERFIGIYKDESE